jgi:hypothetical protein
VVGNPEVGAWFKDLDHTAQKPMLQVRKIITPPTWSWIKLKGG